MKIKKTLKLSLLYAALLTSYEATAFGLPSVFNKTPATPEDAMRKKADSLFPNSLTLKLGCVEAVAKPFNPEGLARYLGEELKILANTKDLKGKQAAMEGITRIRSYVNGVTKCSTSAKDVNFNKVIATKFPPQPGKDACMVPQQIANSPVSGKVGDIDTAQLYLGLITNLYNTPTSNNSLCAKVASTSQQVANNKEASDLTKALGIPTGLTAAGVYLGFPEGLTAPLTAPGVGNKIARLNTLAPDVVDKHFKAILNGVTAKENASKNPKAVGNVVKACQGEMGQVKLPLIKDVCLAASKTGVQNTNNARIVQLKNALGVPENAASGFVRYKSFETGLVSKWIEPGAAEKMVEWNKLDPNGCSQHLNMILKGLQGDGKNTLNPNSTKIVVQACQGEMGKVQVPLIPNICQEAQKTHDVNDLNKQISDVKSELGIPSVGPVRAIISRTCAPQFLGNLTVEGVQKWSALDQAGATEYLDTLGTCFKNSNNPKMAHFIQERCDGGLATVPGGESLCEKAKEHVEMHDNAFAQKALTGFGNGMSTPTADISTTPTDPTDTSEQTPVIGDEANSFGSDIGNDSLSSTSTDAAIFSPANSVATEAAVITPTEDNNPFANTEYPFDEKQPTGAAW